MEASYLTTLEKKAVAKVMSDIMDADGVISPGEQQYMQRLKEALQISDHHLDESKEMSALHCVAILRDLYDDEKESLAEMMYTMITADGDIDEEELKIFTVVCDGAEIPLPAELH